MTTPRLLAIGLILFVATIAWFVLGTSVTARSGEFDARLAQEVAQLWGGPHRQVAPAVLVERDRQVREKVQQQTASGETVTSEVTKTVTDRDPVPFESSTMNVDLRLAHRQKGLLWYDTYTVSFTGRYVVRNPDASVRTMVARVGFPSKDALYDGFLVRFNGEEAPALSNLSDGVEVTTVLAPHAEATLEIRYTSRGLDQWRYAIGEAGVSQARNLTLRMTTNFRDVDFPAGTISPTSRRDLPEGARLDWTFTSLVTGQSIGVDLPAKNVMRAARTCTR